MPQLNAVLRYIQWPTVLGLILALSYLAFYERHTHPTTPIAPPASQDASFQGPVSYAEAVSKASKGVVSIYTRTIIEERAHPYLNDPTFRHFFNRADIPRRKRMQSALGSGVIVTQEGHILTNYHVIADVDEIIVALADGRNAHAQVLGEHQERDLAVLKIELDSLSPISISENTPEVGDVVLAIGNPFGVGQSVSQGIISATRDRHRDLNISIFEDFLQTDAAIHPGSSGGALTDAFGNLVGINTANLAQSGGTGIGFAVPVSIAMQTLTDIVQFGRVVRGWLGVEAKPVRIPVNDDNTASGVIITNTVQGGPAEMADLKIGDIVVGIDGAPIKDARDIMQRIQESRPGDSLTLDVLRKGKLLSLNVVLQEQPSV